MRTGALTGAVVAVVLLGLCLKGPSARAGNGQDPVTVSGKIVCAKCTLHVQGQSDCQNVLLVHDGQCDNRYWVIKNAFERALGDVCAGEKSVTVTGTTNDADGRRWITPARIESAPRTDAR